jgi:hypothetical protein
VTDLRSDFTFYGRRVQYDWESVEHLLGKQSDGAIAARLGCSVYTVRHTRRLLGIERYRKADEIRPVLGQMSDKEVAERYNVSEDLVARCRAAEGIPPVKKKKRRDAIKIQRARHLAEQEDA